MTTDSIATTVCALRHTESVMDLTIVATTPMRRDAVCTISERYDAMAMYVCDNWVGYSYSL